MWGITDDALVQNGRTVAMLLVALLLLWLMRTIHFKFGSMEATLDKAEKQLNGRSEHDPTVSADVSEIRVLVQAQTLQLADVHANILVGEGQREAMRRVMTSHVAVVDGMVTTIASNGRRLDALELRATLDTHEAVAALETRMTVIEAKLDAGIAVL